MPRYHFHVEDGIAYPDLEGTECSSLEAARTEAVLRSGIVLHKNARSFWGGSGWKLIVTDAEGMVMFTLHFFAVSSPATEYYGHHATAPAH